MDHLKRLCVGDIANIGHFQLDAAQTRIFVARHISQIVGMLWIQVEGNKVHIVRLVVDVAWRFGAQHAAAEAPRRLWMHAFRTHAQESDHSIFRLVEAACILKAKAVWMGDEKKKREGLFQLAAAEWRIAFPGGKANPVWDVMVSGCTDSGKDLFGFSLEVAKTTDANTTSRETTSRKTTSRKGGSGTMDGEQELDNEEVNPEAKKRKKVRFTLSPQCCTHTPLPAHGALVTRQ